MCPQLDGGCVTPSDNGACEAFVCEDWPWSVGGAPSSSAGFASIGRRLGEAREEREVCGNGVSKKLRGETLLPAVWNGRLDDEREFERARGTGGDTGVCGKVVTEDDDDGDEAAPTRGKAL